MRTTATRPEPSTARHSTEPGLFLAVALREKTWQLGCTTGDGQPPRARRSPARHQARLLHEVAQAKRRFGLPEPAPVVRGDEAGRAGCWLHRFVPAPGLTHQVVDSSALAVKRRQRRAKRDGLAVRQVWTMLRRSPHGARGVWPVVQVPSREAADPRHRPRDVAT